MTTYLNRNLKISELQLGDVVQLLDGPWGTAIVKQIKNGDVTFYRPYGHADNFSYTGGVICYTGLEEFSRPISDKSEVLVWRREELK